ncbi:MAG: AAA family ATPase [Candidatus Melainabacteria bacterium]
MSNPIRIVIIDEDEAARGVIRSTVEGAYENGEVLAETDSLVYGYEVIRHNRPNMVFVDLRKDPQKSIELINRISTYFRESVIIVSGETVSMDLVMALMQAGAREFIRRPFQPEDVQRVIDKYQMSLNIDHGMGDNSGRIVTVFSNKGGLGKTTIAVNTALALSKAIHKPVVIVDLNLQLGDITTFLDIEPKQTIVDIARNIGRVDKSYLESSLAEFNDGQAQVYILADPMNVEEAEDLTAEQINAVLTVLRASFEYVVIDTTTSFDSKTLTALDLADDILLVSIVNLPSIRSSQRLLGLFERLGYDKHKIKLVVNRYVNDDEITIDDVEDTLEHPVFWQFPNAYHVIMTAINRGIPIDKVDGSRQIVQNYMDFAYKLCGKVSGDEAGETTLENTLKPTRLLGNLFGKH